MSRPVCPGCEVELSESVSLTEAELSPATSDFEVTGTGECPECGVLLDVFGSVPPGGVRVVEDEQ